MSKKNKKLNQMFLNFRQEAEKREISEFQNGGYKQNADDITRQAKSISQGISAGKNMTREIEQYTYQLNHFQDLIQKSGFDESWKSDANQFATTHHDSISTLTEANSARIQQRQLQEKRDKEQNTGFWNKVGSTVLSAFAAMAGGENANNAVQVRENAQAEEDITLKASEREAALQKQINENYAKYAPFLDREKLKKSLHDGSLSGKALKYAEEDYQAADEYKKAELAAKALKNKDIKKYVKQSATSNADSQAAKVSTVVSTLLGNKAAAPLDFNKMLESAESRDEKKRKISSLLTKRGYKTTEGITADDIAEYLVDQKTREINFDRAQQTAAEIKRVSTAHPVLSTGLALATAPLKTIGTADTIAKTVEGWLKDEKVYMDANDPIYSFNNLYSNVVSTTAENLKNNYGDFASEAYRFGVNLADNGIRAAATMLLGGGKVAEAISLVSMGLGVMNDTAVELTNLGMDAKSAGTLSFIAGGAEVVTEMVPLDNLLGMLKNKSVLNKQQIIRGIVTQILTEGGEEGMSDVINDVADVVYEMVSVNPSRRQLEIEQLMKKEGLSYEEAYRQWSHDHTLDYIRDIAGGMLSGGIMAGGAMGTNAMINNTAAGANIMQYGRGNKSAVKAEIQGIIDSAAKEGQTINKKQANVIRLNQQMANGGLSTGNKVYDALIENGLNSTDASVRKQAQKLAVMRDQNGRQSLTGIGKLQNLSLRANTNVSLGVASQIMDEVGADEHVKDVLISALKQEEISTKDLKLLLNDDNARNLIADLSGARLDEDSNLDDIEEAIAASYGNTFSVIDNSTDYGRAYTVAAQLKAEGEFGQDEDGRALGTNAMRAFYNHYTEKANMSLDDYSAMFRHAYNLSYAGKSKEEIAGTMKAYLEGTDEMTQKVRARIVGAAAIAAQDDKKLLEARQKDKALKKKEQEKAKAKRRAEKKAQEAKEREELARKFKEMRKATVEGIESAMESTTLKSGENVNKHAEGLTIANKNNTESKKALREQVRSLKENGGAVIYKKSGTKLSGTQAAMIAAYEYLGKKRGLVYVFTDDISDTIGGEYKDGVIIVSLASAANMTAVAGHELGHYLAQNYAEEYKELSKYVQTALEAHGESIAARVLQVQALYERQTGQKLDYDEAVEEIVNNALFSVDIKSAEFETFIKEHTTLAQRILDAIHELLRDLSAFFKTATGIKEVETLRGDLEYMQEVADRVEEILQKNGNNLSKNTENFAESEQNVQNSQKNSTTAESGVRYSFVDKTDDGRSIYKTNYPKGTPKIKKQNDIINLVQSVWSKNPITLKIIENGKWKTIKARFNPELSERSDLTKIAFGNRKGSASEQRMTLDLAGDLYLIAEESKYVKSKGETGKDFNRAHDNVDVWHYFVTNLVYRDENENDTDCHMNIDVKHNNDGNWFYSFAIEKGTAPQTLLAVVTDESATVPTNSIRQNSEKSNSKKLVLDRSYMQAARNGDEEKAAEYVEQAVEKAFTKSKIRDDNGKLIKVYHGTFADFTEFDSSKGRTNMDIKGSFFSPWDIDAAGYGPNVRAFYLNITNPAPEAVAYKALNSHKGENGAGEKARNDLIKMGYDGVNNSDEEYIAFYPWQIKSADPITHDDNGEIIPLSERFSESKDIRYSVKDSELTSAAVSNFGTTYNWNETGYILADGRRLDFSGKHQGARGGYRTVDHRDIDEVYDDLSGTEAMIDFINHGNIRIMPESGGVELSVVPTKAQKEALDSFISKNRGEITLDISDEDGDNLLSVEYPRGTYSKKILSDIEQYFKDGTEPHVSEVAKFRYQVLDKADIPKALDKRERSIFYSAINPLTQSDGLRIGENGILIPSEDEQYTYKLIHYTNIGSVQVHDIYKIGNYDYNTHEDDIDPASYLIGLKEKGYNEKYIKSMLKGIANLYGTVFQRYQPKTGRYINIARSSNKIGRTGQSQSSGAGIRAGVGSTQKGIGNTGSKQLVYDTAIIDTIRDQEAELARAARESGAYKSALSKRKTYGDKIALIRRQMATTFKTPTYQYEKVAKVADDFLKKYGITNQLDESEKKAFISALHNMYRATDSKYGFGYYDDNGKYHKSMDNAAELADEYAAKAIGIIRDYMTVLQELDTQLLEIKQYFSGKTVYLPESHWQELRYMYGTIQEANKEVPFVRFAKATGKEHVTIEDSWTEAGLDTKLGDYVDMHAFVDLMHTLKDGGERLDFFDTLEEEGATAEEALNEAILDLQNTWAQVMLETTFADNTVMSIKKAKEEDKKAGKKTNRNVAQLTAYKTALKEYMNYAEKAVIDLQKAYAAENERTLATLRELGTALAAERQSNDVLKNDLGDAKTGERIAKDKNRKLTKTVEELTKNNATLAAYVDSLTEEKKQALIDYAEASKKLRRAEKKVETRNRWLEAEKEEHAHKLAEVRLHRDFLLAEYKQKEQQRRKEATERKRQTELRGKIRRKFIKIASLAAANSKTKHVPNDLIDAVKTLLQSFEIYGKNTKAKVDLESRINKIGKSFESDIEHENAKRYYKEFIESRIKDITVKYNLDSVSINDMSSNALEDIYELVKSVMKFISDGNKMFAENLKESIDTYQHQAANELRQSKTAEKDKRAVQLLVDNMKPVYFFRQAGSATLEKLFMNVYDGENTWANDITEARDKEQELRKKYHYSDWNQKEKHSFKLSTKSQTLELNLQQIMDLYALYRREDADGNKVARKHLLEGGIQVIQGTEHYRGLFKSQKLSLDKTIYKFTEQELNDVISTLTNDQKRFVHEAQEFLSVDVAKWGNAVSEKLYDVHLFKGKIYFPMHPAEDWVEMQEKKTTGARQIKNFGASQELQKGANNPLALGEFNDVFGNHIDEMALYHAFTLPLEDFQKVYGYRHTKEDNSVRQLLGEHNKKYVNQLLDDLNGGVKANGDLTFGSRMLSRWKKVSVALNSSVIIQQPSAIGRAFAYIEPKYFKPALPTEKNLEEMMVYAPIARIKSMGYFDVDLGRTATEFINENEYKGLKAKGKAVFTDRNYRENLLTVGAEKADELAWAQIWSAAKQKAKAQGYTGEAQLEKAGEIFTECIRMTQVYDSVFSRSGNMRKKGFLASAATAFMSEPTTAYNMVVDAFSGLKSGRTTKKFAASVAASVLTATVINAFLKAIIQSIRHADDDDNIFELFPGEMLGNILDDLIPMNYIPVVKDIYSLASGNTIDRPDMTLVNEFWKKIQKLINDPKDGARWVDLASSTAQLFGIPAVSVVREYRQISNLISHIFTNDRAKVTVDGILNNIHNSISDTLSFSGKIAKSAGAEHILQKEDDKFALVYQLYKKGNKAEALKRYELIKKAAGKDEDGKSKVNSNTLYNKMVEFLTEESSVQAAAKAYLAGNAPKAEQILAKDESLKNFHIRLRRAAAKKVADESIPNDEPTDKFSVDNESSFAKGSIKLNKATEAAAQAFIDADFDAMYENYQKLIKLGYSEKDAEKAIYNLANSLAEAEEETKEFTIDELQDAIENGTTAPEKKYTDKYYLSGNKRAKSTAEESIHFNSLLNNKTLRAAAKAASAGNVPERIKLQEQLIQQGYKIGEIVPAMEKVENKFFSEQSSTDEGGKKTYYKHKGTDVVYYLNKGQLKNANNVTNELCNEYEKAGKTEDAAKEAIRKAITAEFKERYRKANDKERERIRQLMYASGAYKSGFGVVSATRWWLK